MANTIIQLKNSGVPGNVPSTLQPGELAVNYNDGKLYYGNSSNTAVLFDAITEPSGLNGEIQFNSSGVFGASANLKYDTANKTLTVDEIVSQTTDRIFNHANGAYGTANTKLSTSGGTVTGNLSVVGNVLVNSAIVINSLGQWVGANTGLVGPQGPQGFQGDAGAQGFQGDAGAQGFQGVQGASGEGKVNIDGGTPSTIYGGVGSFDAGGV
jgi:hypothetical protein